MSALFIILISLILTRFSELDAYMVSCPTWSKNLGRTLVYTSYDVYISIVANIIHNPAKEGSLRRISFWIMYLTTREVQLVYCWFATFKKVQCSCTTSIDDSFFAVLRVLYKLQTWNCSARSANQNNNNFTVATCIKHVNQQRISCQILASLKKLWMYLVFF